MLVGKQRQERACVCDDVFSSPKITRICVKLSAVPSRNTIVTSH